MRVLLVGSFWPGSLEESYAQAFEQLGYEVLRFDFDKRYNELLFSANRISEKLLRNLLIQQTSKQLEDAARNTKPQLLFVIKGKRVSANSLERLRTQLSQTKIVCFNPDSPWDPSNTSTEIIKAIPIYHTFFIWSKDLVERLKIDGAEKACYLPFAFDPKLHYPVNEEREIQFDLTFVGTYSKEREGILRQLSSLKIGIWGNGWGQSNIAGVQSQAVYGIEAVRAMNRGLCSLNILRPQNNGSHNMRTFEIPATKNVMITTRSEEQEEFFDEGISMLCYSAIGEIIENVEKLKTEPSLRTSLAEEGYNAVQPHTYYSRAKQVIESL